MDPITSLQNEKVKLARALQLRSRTRRKERKIVLEGSRLIGDATRAGERPQFVLYQPEKADYDLIAQLQMLTRQVIPVGGKVMAHVSDTETPAGIVAVFATPVPGAPEAPTSVLILDAIRDPGNLGTILRTALAAGVEIVVLAPGCADPYIGKTLRSAMGAHFYIPIIEASWADIERYCEGLMIAVAHGDGDSRYDALDWRRGWALIMGNEAHGAGEQARRLATERVYIPMAEASESLNAGIAAGVVLYEAARQRGWRE